MVTLELSLNGQAVAKLQIDEGLLAQLLKLTPAVAASAAAPAPGGNSAPLSKNQAIELLARLDKTSREFLKRMAEEHGALTWGETKALFGTKDWQSFAAGPGRKIEKEVRRLLGDKGANLIWRIEHEWIGLEKGEDEVCRLHIDGPALAALRDVAGFGG